MQTTNPSKPDFWAAEPGQQSMHDAEQDALAESALNTARLAISRWTSGMHAPRMLEIGKLHVSAQARWYAQARDGFEAWRAQGGFSQQEHARNVRDDDRFLPGIDIRNSDACIDQV